MEFCEIVSTTVGVPIYIMGIPYYSNYVGFQAESHSSGQPVVVAIAKGTGTHEVSQEELKSGVLMETAERRAMVEELTETLKADGWEQVARGETWFSLGFRRPSRS
jgi:hypothetical protein